jgi:PadR family transcriptional regulator PadR
MPQPWDAQLRRGVVELAVLGALRGGEAYGYELLQRLAATGALTLTESTVYPLLARLSKDGLMSVRTRPSPAGPPRRYYRLTAAGRARLKSMQAQWQLLTRAVDELLKETGP